MYIFRLSPFYVCEYRRKTWHPFRLTGIKHVYQQTCLIRVPSILSKEQLVLGLPSLLSHQSSVTQQIVSQGALWVVGHEEKEGSDKSVALNCYRFSCLNLFLQEVKSLGGAEAEVQRKELSPSLYSK